MSLYEARNLLATIRDAGHDEDQQAEAKSVKAALEVLYHPAADNGVSVFAYILEDKLDTSAAALFANGHRAGAYAQMLADSGDYVKVTVKVGGSVFEVNPKKTIGA